MFVFCLSVVSQYNKALKRLNETDRLLYLMGLRLIMRHIENRDENFI